VDDSVSTHHTIERKDRRFWIDSHESKSGVILDSDCDCDVTVTVTVIVSVSRPVHGYCRGHEWSLMHIYLRKEDMARFFSVVARGGSFCHPSHRHFIQYMIDTTTFNPLYLSPSSHSNKQRIIHVHRIS